MAGTWNKASVLFPTQFTHYWALRRAVGTSAMVPTLPLQSMETSACLLAQQQFKSLHYTSQSPSLHALQTLALLQKLVRVRNVAKYLMQ
jgi:hypothetical protein